MKYTKEDGLLTYIKLLSGTLLTKVEVETKSGLQKIHELRKYQGNTFQQLENISSGDTVVIKGFSDVLVGEYIGILAPNAYKPQQTHFSSSFSTDDDFQNLVEAFKIFNTEQGFLAPKVNNETKEIEISTYGQVHLEVLKELLLERFHLNATFLAPIPNFKEEIEMTTKGFCHYEPKKHFAEVEVEITPYFKNTFESKVRVDDLEHRYQSIIEKTIPEALSCGVILGRPLTNMKVTLIAGVGHEEHTHGGDFRIATIRAVRQALERNKSHLLEPVLSFKVSTPNINSKDIIKVFNKSNILFIYVVIEDNAIFTGEIPVTLKEQLEKSFISYVDEVKVSYENSGYIRCLNEEALVEEYKDRFHTDTKLFNSISLFREKKKMKKVT